jgi:hypothetical protein
MTEFTPKTRAEILARVELGMSLSEAARAVGVPPATARGWLFRGRKAEAGAYREFADAVGKARADADRARRVPLGKARAEADRVDPASQVSLRQLVRAGSIRAARCYWGMLKTPARGLRRICARRTSNPSPPAS